MQKKPSFHKIGLKISGLEYWKQVSLNLKEKTGLQYDPVFIRLCYYGRKPVPRILQGELSKAIVRTNAAISELSKSLSVLNIILTVNTNANKMPTKRIF